MSAIYPRFTTEDAIRALAELERQVERDAVVSPYANGTHHPRAYFGLGGSGNVSVRELLELRSQLETQLATVSRAQRNHERKFDLLAGAALAQWFAGSLRGQAAHPGMWAYLTIAVLPDFAMRRFPADSRGKLPSDRYLAGRRNVFYRAYLRSLVLGPLLNDPELELFEDELVGLIDRSLSADHRLARMLSEQIASTPPNAPRRAIVRSGLKAVQFESRVTDLASLDTEELRELIRSMFDASRALIQENESAG